MGVGLTVAPPIDLRKTNGHSRALKTRDLGCHYDLRRSIDGFPTHLPKWFLCRPNESFGGSNAGAKLQRVYEIRILDSEGKKSLPATIAVGCILGQK